MPSTGTRTPDSEASSELSAHERVAAAFAKLQQESKAMQATSDELAKPIQFIEACLGNLNIGVNCWIRVEDRQISDESSFQMNVGYAQVAGGAWRVAIETWEGPDDIELNKHGLWAFNEAPKHLRIKAVDKLPDMIEAMVSAAAATRERMHAKIATAQEIARAVRALVVKK